MAADVESTVESSVAPFVCGLCNDSFRHMQQYYLHHKSHNTVFTRPFHICEELDSGNEGTSYVLYKCEMCSCQFRSICTLHDHLTKCVDTGSYIYDNAQKTAYPLPLGSECSFYESRHDGVTVVDSANTPINTESETQTGSSEFNTESEYAKHIQEADKFWLKFCQSDVKKEKSVEKKSGDVTVHAICDLIKDKVKHLGKQEEPVNKNGTVKRKRGRPKKAFKAGDEIENYAGHSKGLVSYKKIQESCKTKKRKCKSIEDNKLASETKKGRCNVKINSENVNKETTCTSKSVVETLHKQSSKNLDVDIKKEVEETPECNSGLLGTYVKNGKCENDQVNEENHNDLNEINDSIKRALGLTATYDLDKCGTNIEDDAGGETDEYETFGNNNTSSVSDEKEVKKRVVPNLIRVRRKQSEKLQMKQKKDSQKKLKSMKEREDTEKKKKTHKKILKGNIHFEILNEPRENKPKKKPGRKKLDNETCDVCGKSVRRSKMKIHSISHSDVRPHKCARCPKTYKYPEHLAMHMKSHEDVLPFYCEVCGQGFIDVNRLKRHAMMHTEDRPYKCEICKAGFVTKYKLNRHMYAHTGIKSMQCDLCGMRFAHKESLSQHISGIHKKERRFSCSECDKKFFTNYQLKCHSMKHSGLRPFKCSHCKTDFIERKELRRHMRKLHKLNLDGRSISTDITLDNKSLDEDSYPLYQNPDSSDGPVQLNNPNPASLEIIQGTSLPQEHFKEVKEELSNVSVYLAPDHHGEKTCDDNKEFKPMHRSISNQKPYEACLTSPLKHLPYENHVDPYTKDDTQFNICHEQKDARYGLVHYSQPPTRPYLPMTVYPSQGKHRLYDSLPVQQNKDTTAYESTSRPKVGLNNAHTFPDQSKYIHMYNAIHTHEHNQDKNFTVL